MVEFWTKEYFAEVEKTLNASADFQSKTASLSVALLMVAKEKGAFLMAVKNGTVAISATAEDAKADFTFRGPYDIWVSNHKGEAPLEKLVMTGKLKFIGSIPKIMMMRSQLVVIDNLAQTVDATF